MSETSGLKCCDANKYKKRQFHWDITVWPLFRKTTC